MKTRRALVVMVVCACSQRPTPALGDQTLEAWLVVHGASGPQALECSRGPPGAAELKCFARVADARDAALATAGLSKGEYMQALSAVHAAYQALGRPVPCLRANARSGRTSSVPEGLPPASPETVRWVEARLSRIDATFAARCDARP